MSSCASGQREKPSSRRGGRVWPPDPTNAVPAGAQARGEGLRTIPPRENCGNVDAKQLTKGSRLFIPVNVDGALYSVGDGHSRRALGVLRHRDRDGRDLRRALSHPPWRAAAKRIVWTALRAIRLLRAARSCGARNFIATMGMPITADGRNENCDITLAARNAVIEMIKLLQERGWSREQAYVICSVAVDLRVSKSSTCQTVTVSALLPEDIFQ